jgi:hypothetical protein
MLSCLLIVDYPEVVRPGVRTLFGDDDSVEFCREAHDGTDAIHAAPCRTESSLKNEYDLFEKFPNGSSLWRGSVSEFETTLLRLQELTQKSENQFYAISLATGEDFIFNLELDDRRLLTPVKVERRIKSQAA